MKTYDTWGRKERLTALAITAAVLALLALVVLAGSADAAPVEGGACTGYTAEPATVVAFRPGFFRHVVTVRIYPNVYGTRYTVERWQVGEAVKVTGIACGNSLGIQFRVWR